MRGAVNCPVPWAGTVPESNAPPASVTVCAVLSRLTTSTVAPGRTVSAEKVKFLMVTVLARPAGLTLTELAFGPGADPDW